MPASQNRFEILVSTLPPGVILPRMFRRALCLLVLTAAAFAQSDGREPAPRFNAKSLTGKSYNNATLKGKVVLLQFWTTWCPYCRGEQPLVDKLTQEFGPKGLVVLAV